MQLFYTPKTYLVFLYFSPPPFLPPKSRNFQKSSSPTRITQEDWDFYGVMTTCKASMKWSHIFVISIIQRNKNFQNLGLVWSQKLRTKNYANIQPIEISKKGAHLLLRTPLPQLHTKFHEDWLKNKGGDVIWMTKSIVLRNRPPKFLLHLSYT